MINLYFELSSVADWVIVGLTFTGICIAGYGIYFARKTVDNWQKEKEWDIIIEAISKGNKAINYLQYNSLMIAELQNRMLVYSGKLEGKIAAKVHIDLISHQVEKFKGVDDEISTIYEKLNFIFQSNRNPILELYENIYTHSSKIDNSLLNSYLSLKPFLKSELENELILSTEGNNIINIFKDVHTVPLEELQKLLAELFEIKESYNKLKSP